MGSASLAWPGPRPLAALVLRVHQEGWHLPCTMDIPLRLQIVETLLCVRRGGAEEPRILTQYAQQTHFPHGAGEGAPWTPCPAGRCPLAVRVPSGDAGEYFLDVKQHRGQGNRQGTLVLPAGSGNPGREASGRRVGVSGETEFAVINVLPTCVVTDPSSTYIRQLETKVRLLEGDKPLVQVGRLGGDCRGECLLHPEVQHEPCPPPPLQGPPMSQLTGAFLPPSLP